MKRPRKSPQRQTSLFARPRRLQEVEDLDDKYVFGVDADCANKQQGQ